LQMYKENPILVGSSFIKFYYPNNILPELNIIDYQV
jgi:hypothetical protein